MRRSKERSYVRGFRFLSMTDPKAQKYEMQDTNYCNHSFYNETALFCVFDGHLGCNCSKELIKVFPQSLRRYLKDIILDKLEDVPYIWKSLYKMVDDKLNKFETEGSTSSTVLIWKVNNKKYLQCANLGDSTTYLYRNGQPVPLSVDHKLCYEYERQRIKGSGINLEDSQTRIAGLNVTRAFGDHYAKEMETGIVSEPDISILLELTNQDTHVILASDGLWDVMKPEEAYDIIKECTDMKVASHRILSTALKTNNCTDNVTVIVVALC